MVRIPYIKIPSVRVGSIVPTSNIGTGGATPAPPSPSPITYLTQWQIVGNSEVHGTEIWSCGEYNAVDGKWHILVQPLGGSIADIALTEPLRKVNDVADTIEFPSETEGKALVTRNLGSILMGNRTFSARDTKYADYKRFLFMAGVKPVSGNNVVANGLCSGYNMITNNQTYNINADGTGTAGIGIDTGGNCYVFDPNYNTASDANAIKAANADTEFIYELATPTTELVDAPQIEEAESYTCVISQGAKAVSWSSFETDSE